MFAAPTRLLASLIPLVVALPAQAHRDGAGPDPTGHAPAGVMYEHMHAAGEWMIGYRYIYSRQTDLFHGGDKVGESELAAAGYGMAPQEMTMSMHMLDIMYAPTDWFNVMLMPQYMDMDMSMRSLPGMGGGMHGHGHSHDHGGAHDHGTSGIGDTIVAGLFRLYRDDGRQLHAGLGISAPTGSVDERNGDGTMVHYGMQLGSGTWDLIPSLTYLGSRDRLCWGAQLSATLRMEGENDRGFAFGDQYRATAWSAWRLLPWASASLRLGYAKEGDIDGHYDRPHNHSSPGDVQRNYGGEVWDVGIGINTVVNGGVLRGHRLGVEWSQPFAENYNGYQLGRDGTLSLSWSLAL